MEIPKAKYRVGDRIEIFYDNEMRSGTVYGSEYDEKPGEGDSILYSLLLDYDPSDLATAWESEFTGLVNSGASTLPIT
jgi:hypothetical protein